MFGGAKSKVEVDCTKPLDKGEKPPKECHCKDLDKHGKKLPNACIEHECWEPLKEHKKPSKECFCDAREKHGMKKPEGCIIVDCSKKPKKGE